MNRRAEWVAVTLVYTFIAFKIVDYGIEKALVRYHTWRTHVPS